MRRASLLPLGLALQLLAAAPVRGDDDAGWFEARIAAIQRQIRLAGGEPLSGRASRMACGYVAPPHPSEDRAGGDAAFERMLRQLRRSLQQRED